MANFTFRGQGTSTNPLSGDQWINSDGTINATYVIDHWQSGGWPSKPQPYSVTVGQTRTTNMFSSGVPGVPVAPVEVHPVTPSTNAQNQTQVQQTVTQTQSTNAVQNNPAPSTAPPALTLVPAGLMDSVSSFFSGNSSLLLIGAAVVVGLMIFGGGEERHGYER